MWTLFHTLSIVKKTLNIKQPVRLHEVIKENVYAKRRRPLGPKFWNKYNHLFGGQIKANRAGNLLNTINFEGANGIIA